MCELNTNETQNANDVNYDNELRYAPLTDLKNVHQLFTRPYVNQGYRGAGANNLHLKDF